MPPARKWTPEEISDIITRYQNGEARLSIARSYRVLAGTIRDLLTAHNIKLRNFLVKWERTPEIEQDIVDRYTNKDQSTAHIATLYGVSALTIKRILAQYDVTISPRGGQYRTFTQEELATVDAMAREGKSQEAIAKALHSTQIVISRIIRQHGLYQPRRGRGKGPENFHATCNGRIKSPSGYWQVLMTPDHPFASIMRGRNSYVLEHRLVMANYLERALTSSETVHHINGDKTDNRIENLQLRVGRHGIGTVYECACCGSRNIRPVELDED